MACNITAARGIDCRDAIGGLKAIYICSSYCSDILKEATVTASSYTITTAGFANWDIVDSGSVTVFKYDLVTDLSNFTTAIEADKATGSVMYNQTLNVVLHKVVAADLFQLARLNQTALSVWSLSLCIHFITVLSIYILTKALNVEITFFHILWVHGKIDLRWS